jgi:hypothetical protein
MTLLRVGLVLVIAVAAVIVANVILLGIASGSREPVGRLRPVIATHPSATTPAATRPTPTTPTPSAASHDSGAGESEDD